MASIKIEQAVAVSQTLKLQPATSQQISPLPTGFPKFLSSSMSWIGNQYSAPDSYVVVLESEDAAELDCALEHFKSKCTCLPQ